MGKFDVAVMAIGHRTNAYFYGQTDFSREANFTENFDYVGRRRLCESRYAQLGKRTTFIGMWAIAFYPENS